MPSAHHINPRFRAYGKARIDVTRRAQSEAEFQQLWRPPAHSFVFVFSQNEWKFCLEYRVDDFAAEVGFYIDILGFTALAFSPSYAQFTDPSGGVCISVAALREGEKSTPADAIRLQFKVADIIALAEALEKRGIVFERRPEPLEPGSAQAAGFFRTPHGVCVDLWGEVVQKPDILDLLDEDEAGEAETDAIIQRLLNLPEKPSLVEEDELFDEDSGEEPEDIPGDAPVEEAGGDPLIEEAPPALEKDADSPEGEPPPVIPSKGDRPAYHSKLDGDPRPAPPRLPRKPFSSGWSASSGRPLPNPRGNGELTYQPIDDSDLPDEDDL